MVHRNSAVFEKALTREEIESFMLPIMDKIKEEATFLLGLWSQLDSLARQTNPTYKPQMLVREFYFNFMERRDNEACMEVIMNQISRSFYPEANTIDVHYTAPYEQWFTEVYAYDLKWSTKISKYWREMLVAWLWDEMLEQLNEVDDFSAFPIINKSPHPYRNLDLTTNVWDTYDVSYWTEKHTKTEKEEALPAPISDEAWNLNYQEDECEYIDPKDLKHVYCIKEDNIKIDIYEYNNWTEECELCDMQVEYLVDENENGVSVDMMFCKECLYDYLDEKNRELKKNSKNKLKLEVI